MGGETLEETEELDLKKMENSQKGYERLPAQLEVPIRSTVKVTEEDLVTTLDPLTTDKMSTTTSFTPKTSSPSLNRNRRKLNQDYKDSIPTVQNSEHYLYKIESSAAHDATVIPRKKSSTQADQCQEDYVEVVLIFYFLFR